LQLTSELLENELTANSSTQIRDTIVDFINKNGDHPITRQFLHSKVTFSMTSGSAFSHFQKFSEKFFICDTNVTSSFHLYYCTMQ